jgi:hypothetical protein
VAQGAGKRYISGKDDPGKTPGLRPSRTARDGRLASPHIRNQRLAAKPRDIDGLRLLADIVEVDSIDETMQICTEFYPDEPVPQDIRGILAGNSSAEH